ncbi:Transposase [Shigella dysenteriae 1617]|uniref:Transposase n=1 Tax=Shigella dysenteriae 1617 TaxID=754093 RepID=A0A0A7A1G6_SHIDY|nr:Transposase [Shigella dysenteriae 1617]
MAAGVRDYRQDTENWLINTVIRNFKKLTPKRITSSPVAQKLVMPLIS